MPSKQSEAVRRRWEAARLAMAGEREAPDDESWGDLTAEPREVDYLETEEHGPVFVLEFVDGVSLRTALKLARRQNTPLPESLAAHIGALGPPSTQTEVGGAEGSETPTSVFPWRRFEHDERS